MGNAAATMHMDLPQIAFLLRKAPDKAGPMIRKALEASARPMWQGLPAPEFQKSLEDVRNLLGKFQGLLRLFDLRILADSLLFPETVPENSLPLIHWIHEAGRFFPGIPIEAIKKGRFLWIPVFLVLREVRVCRFVLGQIPPKAAGNHALCVPPWAEAIMARAFRNTISTAAEAAHRASRSDTRDCFLAFPLTEPNASVQFEGTSAGLGLALGFLALLENWQLSSGIAASGGISPDGAVLPAANLDRKSAHAAEAGFTLFLHPAGSIHSRIPKGIEAAIPVSTLSEARAAAHLYAPGNGRRLVLFLEMLNDPERFVNNCDGPHELLSIAGKEGMLDSVMDRVAGSHDLFGTFLQKMKAALRRGDLDLTESLAELFSPKIRKRIEENEDIPALEWCQLNLELANHRGKTAQGEAWCDALARKRKDQESFFRFANLMQVKSHNRYRFDPDPLDEKTRKFLHGQESAHRSLPEVDRSPNHPLGCFYGTLAQNAAFCGPEHLSDFKRYEALAREAFGERSYPALFREDWLRQYSCRVFAFLDAALFSDAEEALKVYLGFFGWPEIEDRLTSFCPWRHAALARFLAETGHSEAGIYLEHADKIRRGILRQAHPWQLWLFNMGRIALSPKNPAEAETLFVESLKICLSEKLGPTVRVMALLPLSGLATIGRLPDKRRLEECWRAIAEAGLELDPDHFRMLRTAGFAEVMDDVRNRPAKWFPFTYR